MLPYARTHDLGENPRASEPRRRGPPRSDHRRRSRPAVHARDARDGPPAVQRDRDDLGVGPGQDRRHAGPLGSSSDAGDREDAPDDPRLLSQTRHPAIHDVGDHGIVHQLIAERGYAQPGELIIGSDSHTNMVGAVGAFAAGIGATDTAAVMATGRLWLRVPETLRVDIRGTLSERTTAKDVILKVIGTTGDDGARYAAVEFTGSTVKGFPMNERFVLCNMTTEMGAKVGLIEADQVTKQYLAHSGRPFHPIASDEDAAFSKTFSFEVDGMGPQVACPSNPANLKPVEDVEGTKIDVAFLGSCTNARIEDLRIAAELLKGEKIAPGVRFQITPASQIIYRQALKEGLVEIFLDAGATFTSSTCGPCFGGHLGTLAGDEVCISSTNRIYPGRMGSPQAQVYLASPWTVTASAIHGEITIPFPRNGVRLFAGP